jgi:quinol monooxygenase YgiN
MQADWNAKALLVAFATLLLMPIGMAQSTEFKGDNPMYVVMVEFPVKPEESDDVVATVRGLLDTLVSQQGGFQLARIHRESEGGKVINYMQWSSKDAFENFRSLHKDQVSAAIGKFGPKFSFYRVQYTVEPKH